MNNPQVFTIWGVYEGEADEIIREVRAYSDIAACAVANSAVREFARFFQNVEDGVAPLTAYVVDESGNEVYRTTH